MNMLQLIKQLLNLLGKPFFYLLLLSTTLILFLIRVLLKIFSTLIILISLVFKPFTKTIQKPYSSKTKKSTKTKPAFKHPFVLTISFLFLLSLIISTYFIYQFLISDLPDITQLTNSHQRPSTTHIYDRQGHLLYQIYKDQNRTPVNLYQLPPHLIYAHISIEDSNFYNHPGINPPDILRAAYTNTKNILTCKFTNKNCQSNIFGASTITQQLIKNTLLTPERTWKRKLQEVILALQLERLLTKDIILEKYLNTVSYGGTSYGIEAAARTYFNKSATQLNLNEATVLAGLPAAPTTYSPFGAQPELATQRQHQVLRRMREEGYITKEQEIETINQPLKFATPDTSISAPHFVMYLRQLLENQLGPEIVSQGGLEIITSLDLNLQNFAQEILEAEISSLKSLNVSNGAVLITRPSTGEILTMIGSLNYFDTQNQGNYNATTALRQPGSAIKPINYATALSLPLQRGGQEGSPLNNNNNFPLPITNYNSKKHYTAASIINDSPITINVPGQPPYQPVNYDGKFHGKVTLRTALASSYNIPAIKVLNSYGVHKMIDMGQALGITTWNDRQRFGLSLTLGGGEVKMTDLAVAYGTFANLGYRVDLNPVLNINQPSSNILSTFTKKNEFNNLTINQSNNETLEPVLDPGVAFLINHILSDNQARTPGFGRFSKLNIEGYSVAVKTGTSNDLRDNWAIGYTPDYLVAVWVGNFDNSPMSRVASGITGATPIWHHIMTYLLNEYQDIPLLTKEGLEEVTTGTSLNNFRNSTDFPWATPEGLIQIPICTYTGTLPCSGCPTREEWFIDGTQPTRNCSPNWFISPSPQPQTNTITQANVYTTPQPTQPPAENIYSIGMLPPPTPTPPYQSPAPLLLPPTQTPSHS